MIKFRMTCPNCFAVVVTSSPETLVWELCPGCRHHVWDGYDVRMADVYVPGRKVGQTRGLQAEN